MRIRNNCIWTVCCIYLSADVPSSLSHSFSTMIKCFYVEYAYCFTCIVVLPSQQTKIMAPVCAGKNLKPIQRQQRIKIEKFNIQWNEFATETQTERYFSCLNTLLTYIQCVFVSLGYIRIIAFFTFTATYEKLSVSSKCISQKVINI